MSKRHAGRELTKWVFVISTALLSLYTGAYLVLVHRSRQWEVETSIFARPAYANFRSNGRVEFLFAPIYHLDCRIRPHVWIDLDTIARLRSSGKTWEEIERLGVTQQVVVRAMESQL